jgi:epsilon-lactone hydrolase
MRNWFLKLATSTVILLLAATGLAAASDVFVPSTVSPEAASIISSIVPLSIKVPENQGQKTREQWQADWQANEEDAVDGVVKAEAAYPAKLETMTIAGADHLLITPDTYDSANDNRLIVYVHGGAHTFYSPETTLISSLPAAHYAKTKLLSIRYPLAWQAPHPAARDLIVEVYEQLLKDYSPRQLAIYGDSAGGNAVMSAVLKIRDDGLPMPAVVGLISPWADISNAGDSQVLLVGADPVLPDYERTLRQSAEVYAGGAPMTDPSISPVYADFNRGFPPTIITTGTRDLFLSHTARVQRKLLDAGVDTQLIVYEGMWHVFQGFRIPEERAAWLDMIQFFDRHLAR